MIQSINFLQKKLSQKVFKFLKILKEYNEQSIFIIMNMKFDKIIINDLKKKPRAFDSQSSFLVFRLLSLSGSSEY